MCKMVEITKCDVQTVLNLKTRLSQIYKVIDSYRWIIEAYVSDFYVKDHWSRLPPSWQEFLDQVDFPALSCLLTGQPWSNATTGSSVSPLSLLALKAFVEQNALNRRFVDLDSAQVTAAVAHTLVNEDPSSASPEKTQVNMSTSSVVCNQADKRLGFRNGQLMEMEHIFRKHVKPKKQHEIRQLGKVIGVVTEASASDHIVDVGAGLGHLSRLLTFAHGLKVTTVEAAGGHAPKATEFDRELKKDIQKKLKRKEPSEEQEQETLTTPADLPNHVVCRVEPDISTEDFLALVLHGDSGTHSSAEGTVSPSSGNATDSAQNWGSSNAMFMDCKDISQTERVSGLRELHKKTVTSASCSESCTPSLAKDQNPSEVVNVRDTYLACSAASVCSKETVSKVGKYEEEFRNCPKCDREGGSSAQSKTEISDLSSNHGTRIDNEHTISVSRELSDSRETSVENRDHSVNSLNREPCLSQSGKISGHQNQTNSEELQSYIDVNIPECAGRQSKRQSQNNREVQTLETNEKEAFVLRNNIQGQTSHEQKLCGCPNTETQSVGTELKENIKENICDEKKDGFAADDGSGAGGGKERKRLLLAGLHACGDLTATLFRVFVNCPAVSALVSVGCCYMKLSAYSEGDEAHCERGYPLSQYVRSLPIHPLTYEAREMACHFADAYAQRLLDNPPHLKIHSYRAAVQYVVTSVRPDFVPGATRLIVKKGAEIPFLQYASQCLRRLGMDAAEVADDVMTTAESMTTDWRRVVAFYTLRLSLAPLVETALLLDRMLFLYEHGMTSVAVPVFDSKLSPRNFALLACKPRSS